VTEHRGGLARAQQIAVLDAVGAEHHRRDHRHDRASAMRRAVAVAEIDRLIDQPLDPEPARHQPGSITPALTTARSSQRRPPPIRSP